MAKEFAQYLIELTQDKAAPKIIEVHSPYTDYLKGIDEFLDVYIIEQKNNVQLCYVIKHYFLCSDLIFCTGSFFMVCLKK